MQDDMFSVEVETIRELTPDQVDAVGGGEAGTITWTFTTFTFVPGTETTVTTVTAV